MSHLLFPAITQPCLCTRWDEIFLFDGGVGRAETNSHLVAVGKQTVPEVQKCAVAMVPLFISSVPLSFSHIAFSLTKLAVSPEVMKQNMQ